MPPRPRRPARVAPAVRDSSSFPLAAWRSWVVGLGSGTPLEIIIHTSRTSPFVSPQGGLASVHTLPQASRLVQELLLLTICRRTVECLER